MPEGRRLRRALAIALLALVAVTGLLMMAKEQQMGQEISPFDGRSNLALAQAVARGDTQGIRAQATQDRLREQDSSATLSPAPLPKACNLRRSQSGSFGSLFCVWRPKTERGSHSVQR